VLSNLFAEKDKDLGLIIDFENAKPSGEAETKVYEDVAKYLGSTKDLLKDVAGFKGCDALIKASISNTSPDAEENCWKALLPSVDILKTFFDFSEDLTQVIPKLLNCLFSGDQNQNLATQQALAKQLADILDFVLRFDDAKMKNPAIQNDFSYYRRSLNKGARKNEAKIKDDMANRMSLFFAYPTPMLKVVTETTAALVKTGSIQKADVVQGFILLANVCLEMVQHNQFDNQETQVFCLRAMTAAIVVVDHIDEAGAFHKSSKIHIKNAIGALNAHNQKEPKGKVESLLNALRYSTLTLNKPETPPTVKQMLNI